MIEQFDEAVLDRTLYLAVPERIDDWPVALDEPMRDFVLLLALDARTVSDEAIDSFAEKLLRQGVAYVATWGPDAKRVHDLFDIAVHKYRPWSEERFGTDWNDGETLDDALREAIWAPILDEAWETCNAVLAVAVGNLVWAEQLRTRLSNPRSLHDLGPV